MKKKVVYLTQWVAKDRTKEYPHGYGFIAPVVEFPMDMDAAECVEACRELYDDEFECVGAVPIPFIDGAFEILGLTPQDEIDVTYPMSIVYWNNARNMSQEEFTKWMTGSTEQPAKAVEAMDSLPAKKSKEAFEGLMIDYAWEAWKVAANAFRMYPNQKHTFSDAREYLLTYGRKQFQLDESASSSNEDSLQKLKELNSYLLSGLDIRVGSYQHKIIQDLVEDYVPSNSNTDDTSLASHSCTSGSSIEHKAELFAVGAHRSTNHLYNDVPYEYHLATVVGYANRYIDLIPNEQFYPIIIAACWAHDTIEDTRKTYNDVKEALGYDVAEIVYALTNDKGRSRKERASEKYYNGIRNTIGATFVKICDRLANIYYSIQHGSSMAKTYKKEHDYFKKQLYRIEYTAMFEEMERLLNNEQNVQGSDTTDDAHSGVADNQNPTE